MPEAVYAMLTLCDLVEPLPVGTHLGMLDVPWMVVSGRLLEARGAVIPGLSVGGAGAGRHPPHLVAVFLRGPLRRHVWNAGLLWLRPGAALPC